METTEQMSAEPARSLSVLLVNDYSDVAGGAEEQLHREAALLESAGHDVASVGFARPSENRPAETDYVLFESDHRPTRILQKVAVKPGIYRGLRSVLERVDPDVVHIHKNINYPVTVLTACREYPIVKTHHDYTNVCPSGWAAYADTYQVCPGGPGAKCVRHGCTSAAELAGFHLPRHQVKRRLQARYVDQHLAPSRRLSEYLERFGYAVETVPYPLFSPEVEPNVGPGEGRFTFAGRLTEEKGVHVLLHAVAHASEDLGVDVPVGIAGDGPEREELERLAAHLGVDHLVEFYGHLDHADLVDVYRRSRAVVVPSLWMENFPNVVIESLSLARPVIGSDRGGIPELLADGDHGAVYPALEHEALADRLVAFLENPDLATERGACGREYVLEHLAEARVREQLETVLYAAVSG